MNKSKFFIMLITVLTLALMLAISVGAEEFYVSSAQELKDANAKAIANSEADIVYIIADIDNAPFVANSSVTYVLQANWTNCHTNGGPQKVASNVDIAFYADGQERTLSFNNNFVFQTNNTKPSNSSITFGGANGGRLYIDMSKYTSYFMFDSKAYTINLYEVTFNGLRMSKGDWTFLSAGVLNIYDGAVIENCYNGDGYLIGAGTINMYGGEIRYNCTSNNMARIIYCSKLNMYGGSIHDNCQKNTRNGSYNNYMIDVTTSANIYGGEIYNNYFVKNASSGLIGKSGTVNSLGYISPSVLKTNYSVSAPYTIESVDGVYKVTSGEISEAANYVRLASSDYSLIFFNSNGSLINAYMVKDGAVKCSFDASSEITVPSEFEWALSKGGCQAVIPNTEAQGVYYTAHTRNEDDGNCETAVTCKSCTKIFIEAKMHNLVKSISYVNYFEKGEYFCSCTNDGCTAVDIEEQISPMLIGLGISVTTPDNARDGAGMVQGFILNGVASQLYEEVTGKAFCFGVVVAGNDHNGKSPLTVENGEVKTEYDNVIVWNSANAIYDIISVKIKNIDINNELHTTSKIVFCGYVCDGDGIKYIHNGKTSSVATGISYSEALELVGA